MLKRQLGHGISVRRQSISSEAAFNEYQDRYDQIRYPQILKTWNMQASTGSTDRMEKKNERSS